MNLLAGSALVAAFALAIASARPAAARTGLGIWHPAVVWLGFEAAFFGVGGLVLAVQDRTGPALFIAASIVAFGLATWASDRVARRRAEGSVAPVPATGPTEDVARIRPVLVGALAGFGLIAIAGTVLRVGIPFLASDITGARTELTGIPVQILRVALPAAAMGLIIHAFRAPAVPRVRVLAAAVLGAVLIFEVSLASRYLAAELVAGLAIALGIAGLRMPRRAVLAIAAVGIVAFGGLQILRAYDQAAGQEVSFAIDRTVNRVFLIQPRTLEALQASIPAEQPFFGGLTWLRRIGPLFGREDVPNLGYWIYPRMFPDQTTLGYAAPGLLGEAWANFGPVGVLLAGMLGIVAERFGALVARRRRAIADIVAGALGILFLARSHALGLNGLLILAVLIAAWRLVVAPAAGLFDAIRATVRWRS